MALADRILGTFGLAGHRNGTPPTYRAIAPGLIVTDTAAWGWYEITPTNSDLHGESGRDREQDQAEAALRVLVGRDCHLRILWGEVTGDAYLSGLDLTPTLPIGMQQWASLRADNIDDLALPSRRVLLGVHLTDRSSRGTVSQADLTTLLRMATHMGRQLAPTIWRARLASPEVLAWSIAREMHRDQPIPGEDIIQGAALARLTSGHVLPDTDHLRILGADGAPSAYAAVLALTDFPERMTTPGGEWWAILNGLETTPLMSDGGVPIPVLAEASWRVKVLPQQAARGAINDKRKLAKEQARSAARGVAGEPPDHVTEARDEAELLLRDLTRSRTMLIDDHPRVVVTAATREDLDAKITSVISAYDGIGITAAVMVDEQREGWLETLPGDRVRVPDLGHQRDSTAAAQSFFWGGSRVGTKSLTTPAIGYTTGSTQELVRFSLVDAVTRGDGPVTVLTGKTRRGKTTAMMLAMLDVCLTPAYADMDPWLALIDSKGDAGGIIEVAKLFGIQHQLLRLGEGSHAGALCAFTTNPPELAVDVCAAQLALLLPHRDAERAAGWLQRAAAEVAEQADPATWKVVDQLGTYANDSAPDAEIRHWHATIQATARHGFGQLIAGQPTGTSAATLSTDGGITVIQLPGLTLPAPETPVERWTVPNRTSVAALRGVLGWCMRVSGSMDARRRAKVVAIPEVHLLTASEDGRSYLSSVARMGAAFGVSLLLDTQDASGITKLAPIVEGISAVFGFAQRSEDEQAALAELTALPDDGDTYDVISSLDRPASNETDETAAGRIRRGHCLYRDATGNTATIQWVPPSQEVQHLLDTSATATADRHDNNARSTGDTHLLEGATP